MASSNDFKLKGALRSPAKTMGPRALRTSGLIKERAREVFLAKGYYGTSVEEISEAAGVSRASFYTYFPSKRDLLYSLGTDTTQALAATLDEMQALEATWTDDDVYEIVRIYVRFLERHGAFMLVWSQATYGDEALAKAGMRTRLSNARTFGQFIQRLSGERVDPDDDPARFGLAALVMIDRYWSYWRVNGFPFSEDEVVETLGDMLAALIASRTPARVTSRSTPGRASRGRRAAPRRSPGTG
jgi:AcrR family transcriptional regulator